MFKDFNIDKFKKMKPPSDSSFDTMREVKDINKIPLDKDKIKKFDNIEKTFKSIADNNGIMDYPSKLIKDLINKSAPIILKLKNYFDRPRPKVVAKKMGIKMKDFEMNSMKTPSYPSGHSAQGILIGMVLSKIYPEHASKFTKAGENISDSRNIAKAHYKSDSKMGKQLGAEMYNHIKSKINNLK
tara:strand:- start:1256 stop:1810 length:555 start_codon:yes stop_codon:yes gene_type:complete